MSRSSETTAPIYVFFVTKLIILSSYNKKRQVASIVDHVWTLRTWAHRIYNNKDLRIYYVLFSSHDMCTLDTGCILWNNIHIFS